MHSILSATIPPPSEVVSSDTDLPPTPGDVLGAGNHEGSTPILPTLTSDTFCSQHAHFLILLLVSILIPANRTGLTTSSRFSRQEISTINKVSNFIISMLQSSGHWVSVLGKYYDDIIHLRWAGFHLHTFLEIQHNQIISFLSSQQQH